MLYVRNTNFLFIHIPRTAGNVITRTLVKELIDYSELITATCSSPYMWRHMNVKAAIHHLGLKNPKVVSVFRKDEEIFKSEFNMMKKINTTYAKNTELYQKMEAVKKDDFDAFKEIWMSFLKGMTMIGWWCGDYNVELIPYDMLNVFWPRICQLAGCRSLPKLDNIDYQLEFYKNNE